MFRIEQGVRRGRTKNKLLKLAANSLEKNLHLEHKTDGKVN
jgi:hypothetical protein